jgi:hypothetical protein
MPSRRKDGAGLKGTQPSSGALDGAISFKLQSVQSSRDFHNKWTRSSEYP